MRHILALLLFTGPVLLPAEGARPNSAEVQVLQAEALHRKEVLEERLRLQEQATKERLEAQDRRIGDLWTHASLRANWGIGLLGFIMAGLALVAYVNAGQKARETVEAWIKENSGDLKARMEDLGRQIEELQHLARRYQDQVRQAQERQVHLETRMGAAIRLIDQAVRSVQKREAEARRAIDKLQSSFGDRTTELAGLEQGERRALQTLARTILDKPEAERNYEDWNILAFEAYRSGQWRRAAQRWERAARTPGASRAEQARALFNGGVALGLAGDAAAELAAYDHIIATHAADPLPALREQVAKARLNRGLALGQAGDLEAERAAYDRIIADYATDPAPALREVVAKARLNQGLALKEAGHLEEAVAAFDLVITDYAADPAPALQDVVAKARLTLGVVQKQSGRLEEAVAIFDLIVSDCAAAPALALREVAAAALFNQGLTLKELARPKEALAAFDRLIATYGQDPAPALRSLVSKALNARGFETLLRTKTGACPAPEGYTRALKDFRSAASTSETDLPMVLGNQAYALFLLGRPDKAEPLLRKALDAGGEALLEAERRDAATHPLPQDAGFLALLARVWAELHPRA